MAHHIPSMTWSGSDPGDDFALFKQKMELYLEDEGITDDAAMARKICRGIGDDGLRRLNASGLSNVEKRDPDQLWNFFEGHLKTKVNFRIHRLQLMHFCQKADEMLDDFMTRARTQALKCDFTEEERDERLLELIIASTPYDNFRRDLLGKEKGYSLKDALTEGRRYEAITAGSQIAQSLGQPQSIHAITDARKPCSNCARQHAPRQCPAFGDKCKKCGRLNHWAKCCRSGNNAAESGYHPNKPQQHSSNVNFKHKKKTFTKKKQFHAVEAQQDEEY